MSGRTRGIVALLGVIVVAACILGAGFGWFGRHDGESRGAADKGSGIASGPSALGAAAPAVAGPDRSVDTGNPVPLDLVGTPRSPVLPPSGVVRLRVVDAQSNVPLPEISARFLGEKRVADYSGKGNTDVALTPGRYDVVLRADGYESIEPGPVVVTSGALTDLGTLALSTGGGVIEGDVLARHLEANQPVVVELFGAGRGRCEKCRITAEGVPDSCEACGRQSGMNHVEVVDSRRFRFERLAAGSYWLRAFDPQQHLVARKLVVLDRNGSVWQSLEVSAPITAEFELRHGRGGPFVGAWAKVHHAVPASIQFTFLREKEVIASVGSRTRRKAVRASLGAPLVPRGQDNPADDDVPQSSSASFTFSISGGISNFIYGNNDPRLDRDRAESDSLSAAVPGAPSDELQLKVEERGDGRFAIGPLPRELLGVTVTCADFASEEVLLDLRFGQVGVQLVTLAPTAERLARLATLELPEPESCTKCHAASGLSAEGAPLESNVITFSNDLGGLLQGRILQLSSDAFNGGEIDLPATGATIQFDPSTLAPAPDPAPKSDGSDQ